jgi:gamma-glutamylcyclotransferase (GGCT)/AIG2-like uncharacterized protein YtfP
MVTRVFVYGTLKAGMASRHLVKPYLVETRPAVARGLLYDLPCGYPAMVPGEGTVHGELLTLRRAERALQVLDCLEDFHGPGHAGNLYERVRTRVVTAEGEECEAWVYYWARPHELPALGRLLPGGRWPPP